MYIKYIKRFLDVLLAMIGSIILSPVLLFIAIFIKLDSSGPILFRQKRVGKGKKLFLILKFRSMRIDAPHDIPTHMLNQPHAFITRFGRFLRKTSLDELPQLFNIIKGDMSVVGPRPALWNQDDLIAERDRYIGKQGMSPNDFRPGLTGWAQINGRDELEIETKARLDGEYAQQVSFLFDIRCFVGTFVSVFQHRGLMEGGTGAMKKGTSRVSDE